MKPALRTPLLAVHLWAGLATGIVMIVVALSGAILIFRGQLERRMDTARFVVEPGARAPAGGRAMTPAAVPAKCATQAR